MTDCDFERNAIDVESLRDMLRGSEFEGVLLETEEDSAVVLLQDTESTNSVLVRESDD